MLLQYADDTTFFIECSVEEARNLSTVLDLFVVFSGLQIDCTKSTFLGFGQTLDEERQCSGVLGTPIRHLSMWYLDLPLLWGRTLSTDWQPVVEKVEKQLEGLQTKMMSRGGLVGDPNVPPFNFQVASGNCETPRKVDEAVPMEMIGTGKKPRFW